VAEFGQNQNLAS